ncbi:hypothetical protein BDC45DRAFT_339666 [Circinella umbellata]|nr:hypothetical protein BDC45DRAFT_339666 [Circinella umbellata]
MREENAALRERIFSFMQIKTATRTATTTSSNNAPIKNKNDSSLMASQHAPKSAKSTPTKNNASTTTKGQKPTVITTNNNNNKNNNSWATITAKNLPQKNKKDKNKKNHPATTKTTAIRALQESNGPSTFDFVYVPCRHHLRYHDVRKMLSTLKIQQSRVLDIYFPATGTVAFLIHSASRMNSLVSLKLQALHPAPTSTPFHLLLLVILISLMTVKMNENNEHNNYLLKNLNCMIPAFICMVLAFFLSIVHIRFLFAQLSNMDLLFLFLMLFKGKYLIIFKSNA